MTNSMNQSDPKVIKEQIAEMESVLESLQGAYPLTAAQQSEADYLVKEIVFQQEKLIALRAYRIGCCKACSETETGLSGHIKCANPHFIRENGYDPFKSYYGCSPDDED